MLGLAWATGGAASPAWIIAPLVPCLAGFVAGARTAVVATLGLLIGLIVLGWLPGWLPASSAEVPIDGGRLAWQIAAILGAAGLSVVFEGRRQTSERRLRQRESLYRRVFEQSKEVVGVTTRDGRIVDLNPAGLDLYGYDSKDELLANSVEDFYAHPEERRELLQRLDSKGYVRGFETRHKTRSGAVKRVAGTTSTLLDEHGEIEYLLTILRDVTAQRELEAERDAMLAELASKNSDLERFTYTVSHDLKSPMTAIYGFLRVLRRDIENNDLERIEHDLATIRGQVDRMAQLTEDLLELARIGLGDLSREELPAQEVAQEAVKLISPQLEASRVEVEIAPDLPRAFADRTLLRLVFQNLIENGAKFCCESPAPRIRVGSCAIKDEAAYFVQDNGVGIAPEHHERVFELFEKLNPEINGTGIGLANVKRAVEVHGGRVWVESGSEGNGSTFFFTIP